MINKKTAISYGAITLINAIASGIGAALGIDLWTKAEVEILPERKIIAIISDDINEDTTLIEKCALKILDKFNYTELGAKIKTSSNIPIARGLKSSSAAANAVTLATVKALNIDLPDIEIVKIGVEASIETKVSITGAFDDSTASYFGGIVLTDNLKKELLIHKKADESLKVALFIPKEKFLTKSVNISKIRLVKNLIRPLADLLKKDEPYTAMTLNGLIYGACFNTNSDLYFKALENGALGVSVSGTGPSIASIVKESDIDKLIKSWTEYDGEIKVVNINNEKAHIVQ